MQENPADKILRDRLEAGEMSLDGFLGNDKRPVKEIIAADVAEIQAAKLKVEEVGAMLEEIHKAADDGWESLVPVFDGKIKARSMEVNGKIPCPFCGEQCHKAVIEVQAGEKELHFTPLDAHMIEEHGFFEGKGSEYRIEPSELIWLYNYCKG